MKQSIAALFFIVPLALLTGGTHAALSVDTQVVASGFAQPVFATTSGDGSGRLFVLEQAGVIRIVDGGGPGVHPVFLNLVGGGIISGGELGLLGLAFHPDYDGSTERRFYVSHTPSIASQIYSRVSEFRTQIGNPDAVEPGSETPLIDIAQPQGNHNGGMIAFGPESPNSHLYIGIGDGGGADDDEPGHTPVIGNSQDTSNALGAILRIDVDSAPDVGLAYHVPADNPLVGNPGAVEEIFAWGLRNPWRFSFDRITGALLAGDVGQGLWEEVDVIVNGGNYGWRNYEGNHAVLGPAIGGTVFPIHEYPHTNGNQSITGGYVHRGNVFTGFNGYYFFADFATGRIWTLAESAPGVWAGPAVEVLDATFTISSFGEDANGELLVCDYGGGQVLRLLDAAIPVGISILGSE